MDNEEKYTEIAEKLKNLEKVEASHNFTHNLQAKIIEFESEKRKEHVKRNEDTKGGFLRDLLGNLQYPWIVPVAGFTVLIFFVFYITYQNRSVLEQGNQSQVNQESKIEDRKIPNEPDKPGENQNSPSVTENKKSAPDNSPESTESNSADKTGNPLSEKNNDGITHETQTNSKKRSEEYATDINPESGKEDKISDDTPGINEHTKTSVPEVTENQGMVSEEKTSVMAAVTPEARDTNFRKKEKNSDPGNMMLRINKIDKDALEKIHEEINR